eukprot:4331440-Amphidinium_carterae.1
MQGPLAQVFPYGPALPPRTMEFTLSTCALRGMSARIWASVWVPKPGAQLPPHCGTCIRLGEACTLELCVDHLLQLQHILGHLTQS